VALNLSFVIIEVVFGVVSQSMALVADAGHNLGDVLGLALAWGAAVLAQRAPSTRRTYGYRRTTILASLANAITLVLVTGGIAWESIQRLMHPTAMNAKIVIGVALAGVLVNGTSALLFMRNRKNDLNVRSAFQHLAADAVLSMGVAVAGGVFLFTGWQWLDPVVSLAINAVIVWGTWGLLRDSVGMSMAAVPPHIDPVEVRGLIEGQPDVASLHDLHIWPMSTTEIALTCHLVMPGGHPGDVFIHRLAEELSVKFRINHATVQIEIDQHCACALAPDDVV